MNQNKRDQNEIEHFTKIDHVWWGLKTPAGQKRYDNKFKKFKTMCDSKNARMILEVGCGIGDFTKRLRAIKNKTTKITAIDVTPRLIKNAKKNITQKNIEFRVDSLHKLSFKNNVFDIVCGISILHHVNLQKSLSEIYRVLKPNGEIFFTEPNMINPVNFLGLHLPFLRKKMEFSPDETAFRRWVLKNELKKRGFKTIKVANYDFLHPNTPKKFIPFVEKLGNMLEKLPLIKEISGSLIIYAKK